HGRADPDTPTRRRHDHACRLLRPQRGQSGWRHRGRHRRHARGREAARGTLLRPDRSDDHASSQNPASGPVGNDGADTGDDRTAEACHGACRCGGGARGAVQPDRREWPTCRGTQAAPRSLGQGSTAPGVSEESPTLPPALLRDQRARRMKRLLDLAIAVPGLVIAIPVIAVAAILIRASSKGPAILAQTRVGHNGVPFTCYKLRTMYADTPAVPTHEAQRSAVTPPGRILRATKLDELPQLW